MSTTPTHAVYPQIYGLYYHYHRLPVSLPLLNVRAEAGIKELAAQVKLTQTYENDTAFPIEAKYSFPIPARAAVCSFVMIKQDGTRVVGSVLEKQEAREKYNTAVSQGQQASLMEQQTSDVFQVSVGNIPPNEQVQIELVYATELSEDEETDSIRFHLPVHIGAHYGQAPQSTPFVSRNTVFISSSSRAPFLTIAASVEAIAPISKIGSPSHTVSTELGPNPKLPNFKELPFSNYARVSLSSDSALDKDFILTIKSAGLDAPRCVAELHPAHDTVALGLTLVPRFKLPDLSRQEFVFLVDRSGSMSGKRIAAARKALVVMLRALPHQESLFQIMSFGSQCSALWAAGSKPYNQQTLEQATRHVDAMQADYGGTEIRAALQQCFEARKGDRPMSVLVLTDGDAWDLDGVLSEVKSAVAAVPKTAYLRVSVLGIGNSASTAMCEGIARLGNGTCMMVGEEETTFTGKIARLLKVARTPPIFNITVDWGHPTTKKMVAAPYDEEEFEIVEKVGENKTLNIFDEGIENPMGLDNTPAPPPPAVVLPPPAAVQQAPFVIRNLFPSIRLNAYAILQSKTVPKSVTLRGYTADGAEIGLPIPVTFSHLQNAPGAPPAIHALAARKIIQDLEDGHHALAVTLANPDDTDLLARTVKASIIRLGKTYSISSSHTSFVAVDELKPETPAAPETYVTGANFLYTAQGPLRAARRGRPAPASKQPSLATLSQSMMAMPRLPEMRARPAVAQPPRRVIPISDPWMVRDGCSFTSPPAPFSAPASPARASNTQRPPAGAARAPSVSTGDWAAPGQADFDDDAFMFHRKHRKISSSASSSVPPRPQPQFMAQSMQQAAPPDDLMNPLTPTIRNYLDSASFFGSTAPAAEDDGQSFEYDFMLDSDKDYITEEACVAAPASTAGAYGQPELLLAPPVPARGFLGLGRPPPKNNPFFNSIRQSTSGRGQGPFDSTASPSDPLEALARLQSFDGCFSLEILSIITLNRYLQDVRNALPAGATDGMVATVLAMAFLATKLGAPVDRDSWEGIYHKAKQYVEAALWSMNVAETADGLQAKVAKMLA
ncbi:von Willebrand factor type A domain-containing protein [Mycena rosella]|uniref:von Willebrand factor type A domain-containing protein n=1 Tax=Mycena rosella TaxID=1033263 RepID=A0AAD7D8F4_MYCRO|nr:von Willebrand factor type A domain-containing protein [Mycena rosella]